MASQQKPLALFTLRQPNPVEQFTPAPVCSAGPSSVLVSHPMRQPAESSSSASVPHLTVPTELSKELICQPCSAEAGREAQHFLLGGVCVAKWEPGVPSPGWWTQRCSCPLPGLWQWGPECPD